MISFVVTTTSFFHFVCSTHAKHILCDCEAYGTKYTRTFGKAFMEPHDFVEYKLSRIFQFLKLLGITFRNNFHRGLMIKEERCKHVFTCIDHSTEVSTIGPF